jgi:hypothetical protein
VAADVELGQKILDEARLADSCFTRHGEHEALPAATRPNT